MDKPRLNWWSESKIVLICDLYLIYSMPLLYYFEAYKINYTQKYIVFKYHLRDFLRVWHLHYQIYIHEILEWKTPFFAKSNNNNHNNKTKRSDNMKMRLTGFKASKCIYTYDHAS